MADLDDRSINPESMNLTRLRYFLTIADEENIVRAAVRLNVAQSALSRQLHALEQEVGTPLFERHARGARLTAAGRALVPHARCALAAADAGLHAARDAERGESVLRIASAEGPHRASLIAGATARMRGRMPCVRIVHDATPWTVSVASLRAGTIDVGFGVAPDARQYGAEIDATWLLPEPTSCAVIPATHPLARRSTLCLADLRDMPTLIPPREQVGVLHDQMLAVIRSGGYEPQVVVSPLSFFAAAQMVVAGAGWIIATESVGEAPPPGTAVIPIEDASVMMGFYLLTRAGDDRPGLREFADCMQEVAGGQAVR